jgi:hypothetical protein
MLAGFLPKSSERTPSFPLSPAFLLKGKVEACVTISPEDTSKLGNAHYYFQGFKFVRHCSVE